jgi:hypothetical protein
LAAVRVKEDIDKAAEVVGGLVSNTQLFLKDEFIWFTIAASRANQKFLRRSGTGLK